MATHFPYENGTMPLIEGRIYSKRPPGHRYYYAGARYVLILHNETTGICKMRYLNDGFFYCRASEVRTWHLIGGNTCP